MWLQNNAVRDVVVPLGVVPTVAGAGLEQFAGHVGKEDVAGVDVFELVQATFTAAVTDAFPFLWVHLFKWFGFPEPMAQTFAVNRVSHQQGSFVLGRSRHPFEQ